ncbi:OX-2 membrane glycoprotein-like isoform X1 [Hippocampus zosterae]|uniref:OX-2 membrane glycoprotein-like isoform X1 n=1 Tax=Hippocampus zosterae TaxID=109293 RepID=UPI00223D91DB|nr:OX-2 membrane glycoprotein-like isoform X1 [Hippocampus zosterae]
MWRQLFLTYLLLKVSSPHITSLGDTTVEYGKDAYYKCELQNQKDVHQITWQKRLRDNPVENLGSYSELSGQHINELYQGKVILNETSLSSVSLILKNVTWADECCYICIFNVYPGDSKRKQKCLTVQGISELKAKVYNPEIELADGTATVVFSCSATGKPAPTIRWRFSPNSTVLHQMTPTTVANRDGTFTRSQNVTLHLTESWDGHAECVVQSGSRGERMKRVTFSWDAGQEKMVEDRETGGGVSKPGQSLLVIVVAVAAAFGMALVPVIIIVKALKR